MPETSLQMVRRHVAEGKARIARQKVLIAQLTQDGHDRMLPQAEELLQQMQEFLVLSEEHLARELAK